jgi:hypothetical protein
MISQEATQGSTKIRVNMILRKDIVRCQVIIELQKMYQKITKIDPVSNPAIKNSYLATAFQPIFGVEENNYE